MHRPNYLRGIDNALSNHIVPAFGDRPLSTLRRSDVQGFVAALSARLAPNSVYTVYRTLSLLLAAAVDDRKIAVSPCVRIKLPSRPTVEVEPPTPGELAELVASAPDRVRGSGGPFGRNRAADQRSARAPGRRRELPQSQDAGGATARPRTNQFVPTKTRSSVRSVPLGQVVVDALAAHLAKYRAARQVSGG
ncbi:MAG TPA: hypothetical protein VFH02_13980 [Jiangellaceae bacterium]|nr:hypothetical protein [Jiangellaceae bacterium]